MKKIHLILILAGICCLSLFFNAYKDGMAPPCFNADEAAFSYNAWSIGTTGKDEYGHTMPLRLTSFGDFKLPLLSYITVPFVTIGGLNTTTARMPNMVLAVLFPLVIYFLVMELFGKKPIALASSFLIATSMGLHLVGRHEHEAYLAAFLVTCMWLFYMKTLRNATVANIVGTCAFCLLSLFAYHSSRLFAGMFFVHALFVLFHKRDKQHILLSVALFATITAFVITDIIIAPARVKSLLFFNSPGYVKTIDQMRYEGSSRVFYNKVMPGVQNIVTENMKYFSPQFLLIDGDENPRFGHPGMGILTLIEFGFFLLGIYFLFAKKEKHRFLMCLVLITSPVAGALSWAGLSITRTLFLLIPILILAAYGVTMAYYELHKNKRLAGGFLAAVILIFAVQQFYVWDFYLNHYPKRALVMRSWQCGYQDLASYIKQNYSKYDKFYISSQYGQPYIFMLFFLQFPPEKFWSSVQRTPVDEYGFTQVKSFDKFVFDFREAKKGENSVFIGLPSNDFGNRHEYFPALDKVKKIRVDNEEIFWIYENPELNP